METRLLTRLAPVLLALTLLPGAPNAAQAAGLRPYQAVYESKLRGFNVHIKRRLEIDDTGITVRIDARRFMYAIHERSQMSYVGESVLRSLSFMHDGKGFGNEHDKNLVFDWSNHTVRDLLAPEREPLAVADPCYDKLGYQTQIRLDLMRNPELQKVEYEVSNSIRNRVYTIVRMGAEVLETPLGKLDTIKFKRVGNEQDRELFMWFAPAWDYLLVRMDQTKKPGGKVQQLIIKSGRIEGQPITGL